jgi:hypothetical protein|tara:strand:+ start:2261 stop:2395 length:135 start_codon:yes stop_codon:yes gene_type:complete
MKTTPSTGRMNDQNETGFNLEKQPFGDGAEENNIGKTAAKQKQT